jgi:hypothetical protein
LQAEDGAGGGAQEGIGGHVVVCKAERKARAE